MRYVSNINISHGEGAGAEKRTWSIGKGQVFDPAEMKMPQETVDRMIARRQVKQYEDAGDAKMAKPTSTPVRIVNAQTGAGSTPGVSVSSEQAPADPKSSVGVRQEGDAGGGRTAAAAAAASGSGSTQGGKTPNTGGSTQGGQPSAPAGGSTQGGKP